MSVIIKQTQRADLLARSVLYFMYLITSANVAFSDLLTK